MQWTALASTATTQTSSRIWKKTLISDRTLYVYLSALFLIILYNYLFCLSTQNIYKDASRVAVEVADEDELPQISLQEMLDDLHIGDAEPEGGTSIMLQSQPENAA